MIWIPEALLSPPVPRVVSSLAIEDPTGSIMLSGIRFPGNGRRLPFASRSYGL